MDGFVTAPAKTVRTSGTSSQNRILRRQAGGMISMQRWFPASRSGMAMPCAMPIVLIAMLSAQVSGFESSLTVLPGKSSSTLDRYVAPQELELQQSVLDFVDLGVSAKEKKPQFRSPKTSSRKESGPKKSKLSTVRPLPKTKQQVGVSSAKLSPFHK